MAYTARSEAEVKEFYDEPAAIKQKAKKLVELIKKSKHMMAFTGAGISTACGIADYRSGINTKLQTGAGKWARQAASEQGKADPSAATKKKKTSTFKAVPSPSHMALIALARAGYLKRLVSQNTDGLHRRSGFPIELLSELHGNSTLEDCATCGRVHMRDYQTRNRRGGASIAKLRYVCDEIKKAMADTNISSFLTTDDVEKMTIEISSAMEFIRSSRERITRLNQKKLMQQISGDSTTVSDVANEVKEKRLQLEKTWEAVLDSIGRKLPRYHHFTGRFCAMKGCGGPLQDTIINFGESLPVETLSKAEEESTKCDLYLVLGSSCTVTPAANMPESVGKKWSKEKKAGATEPEHNLAICNIQKTPLHGVCSLPIHCKIDDLMIEVMREMKLEIPKWYLRRLLKVKVARVNNDNQRRLVLSGVETDGIVATLFKSVVLKSNGERIRKTINNKETVDGEFNFIVPLWSAMDAAAADDVKENEGLSVELEFMGNYEEPKLVIALNSYLDDFVEMDGEMVIQMSLDPVTKVWTVPNKAEQLNDKNIKALWRFGGNQEDEEQKNDE